MTARRFGLLVALVFLLGLGLRAAWLRADPPTSSVGIVWHDEGAWVHNARNAALWGTWRTDAWNPVFVAPVFTALEYVAFETFGVGTWQARTVPVASGLIALAFLIAALQALGGHRAALAGGLLLATDYTWVMWNRAALMESTMTACMVVAWAAWALSTRRPWWGVVAGVSAALAFFTKAAAAFFVAAILLDAVVTLSLAKFAGVRARLGASAPPAAEASAARWMLAGLVAAFAGVAIVLLAPYWTEYQFYNWQMSVTRKPSYVLASFVDRATWLPITHDFFTRMWPVFLAALLALAGIATRWRTAPPAERLLALWLVIGLAELVIHDAGNERRYVMFIPPVIALAALVGARGHFGFAAGGAPMRGLGRAMGLVLALGLGYLAVASALRPLFAAQIDHDQYSGIVRTAAVVSAVLGLAVLVFGNRMRSFLANLRVSTAVAGIVLACLVGWNFWQYARWATARGDRNYRASAQLGRQLPDGTIVQGKLANGMALENRIRPLFVGREFGNYADRLSRDDVRYILTYELPREGYESQPGLIREILDRYPQRRVIATFEVDETPGPDRAVLIEKHARD